MQMLSQDFKDKYDYNILYSKLMYIRVIITNSMEQNNKKKITFSSMILFKLIRCCLRDFGWKRIPFN